MRARTNSFQVEAQSDLQKAREGLQPPLGFGSKLADLMVRIENTKEMGWHDARIQRLKPIELSPAAKVLHYAQEIFEGHKAYKWPNDEVALFRPELNAKRLNASAKRVGLPEIPEKLQLEAVFALTDMLREWVPTELGSSLYIRPAMIGTEPSLGLAQSNQALYFVIASPVQPYFANVCDGVHIWVESKNIRAAQGGIGEAKTGGNYATSLYTQIQAKKSGCDQVLWLDAIEHRYIEELSGMNFFFILEDELITPPLTGTILSGITRRSILEMAGDLDLIPIERKLSIQEVIDEINRGRQVEIFVSGTAAGVASVASLKYKNRDIQVADGKAGVKTQSLHKRLTDIQFGRMADPYGWMQLV